MNIAFWKEPDLDDVTYPASALVVSWLIAAFPMVAIVGTFLYEFCYISGGYEVQTYFILLLLFMTSTVKNFLN